MSITDYDSLKTSIAGWTHRTDLTAIIPDLIMLGEMRIYRDLRVRQMETALSVAITGGVAALPSGYLELKNAYINGHGKLTRKTASWIYENYPDRVAGGNPNYISVEGSNFIFGPYPSAGVTLLGTYYKRLPALSAMNTTNWLITDAPDLILWASLAESAPYLMNEKQLIVWEAKYQDAKNILKRAAKQEEFSGSTLQTTAG